MKQILLSAAFLLTGAVLSAQDNGASRGEAFPELEAPRTTDETAARLIALNLKARGGSEALRGLYALRQRGLLREGGTEYRFTELAKAPNRLRIELRHREYGRPHSILFGTDGEILWQQQTSPKLAPPSEIADSQQAATLRAFRFEDDLLDYERKGHTFGFRGREEVQGRRSYAVQGRLSSGEEIWLYFDPETFLLLRESRPQAFAGRSVLIDRDYQRYERFHLPITYPKPEKGEEPPPVPTVLLPTRWVLRADGGILRSVDVSSTEVNPELPNSLFEQPGWAEHWLRQEEKR